MSADNFYVVSQHPKTGRWYAFMGFASDTAAFTPSWHDDLPDFATERDAVYWADEQYSEYGVRTGPWPEEFIVACRYCNGSGDERVEIPG